MYKRAVRRMVTVEVVVLAGPRLKSLAQLLMEINSAPGRLARSPPSTAPYSTRHRRRRRHRHRRRRLEYVQRRAAAVAAPHCRSTDEQLVSVCRPRHPSVVPFIRCHVRPTVGPTLGLRPCTRPSVRSPVRPPVHPPVSSIRPPSRPPARPAPFARLVPTAPSVPGPARPVRELERPTASPSVPEVPCYYVF